MNLFLLEISQFNSMLVQQQQEPYFNFVNSINSDATRKNYEYCLSRFLKYCKTIKIFVTIYYTFI